MGARFRICPVDRSRCRSTGGDAALLRRPCGGRDGERDQQLTVFKVALPSAVRLEWQSLAAGEIVQPDAKQIGSRLQPIRQVKLPPVDIQRIRLPLTGRLQPGQRGPVELGEAFPLGVMQMNIGDPIAGNPSAGLPERGAGSARRRPATGRSPANAARRWCRPQLQWLAAPSGRNLDA